MDDFLWWTGATFWISILLVAVVLNVFGVYVGMKHNNTSQ